MQVKFRGKRVDGGGWVILGKILGGLPIMIGNTTPTNTQN